MDTKQKILKIIKDHKLEIVNTNNTNQAIWHGVNPKDLRRVFFELAKEGKFIEHGGTGRFFSVESLGYIKGKLSVHPKGFGFFTPDDITEELDKLMGGTGAFFVPANFLKGAMHEDTVLVSIQEDKFKKRGEDAPKEKKMAVVEVILSRGLKNIVGTYKKAKTGGYITPDNKSLTRDIFIEAKESMNAKDGEKVVVRLVGTTLDISSSKRLEGKVVERIGYPDLKGVDIISVARDYNLYQEFPKRVLEEASKIEDEVDDTKYGKRRKFYEHNIVTIDGEDSRDFDDAVHIEKEGDNFRVYVHIADVGEYVPVGSKLDLEAYNRGTSVYFPHYVLPMLPEKLSNGICSLNPNVKRLALTCEMLVNKNAEVLKHDIYESIIISKYRLTYNLVQSILENSKAGKAFETVPESVMKGSGVPAVVDAGVCEDIRNLNMLAKKLEIKRTKRGAIDFDIPEAYIKVDAKGRSTSVEKRPRFDSHRLIESWMVATNEVVAEHFFKIHMPFVYRIHEKPDEKKLDVFSQFVRTFGEKFEEEEAESSLGFQAFLNRIKGKDYEFIISRQALRS
ncbi:MAG: ribonuclease R, partial [Firmicutes bacterium]|nr:ribonuclease R [Bacillota bacterium]